MWNTATPGEHALPPHPSPALRVCDVLVTSGVAISEKVHRWHPNVIGNALLRSVNSSKRSKLRARANWYDQISRFSWIGLLQLFRRAIFSKVLRVPIARIVGTTTFTFEMPAGDDSGSTGQESA
eukprot:9474043-Pyramimonas_sp.AAC.1